MLNQSGEYRAGDEVEAMAAGDVWPALVRLILYSDDHNTVGVVWEGVASMGARVVRCAVGIARWH